MENKKRYSSDELNETDNLIKKYKVDVTTTIDNNSKTEHHETDITEKELKKLLLIFNLLLEANVHLFDTSSILKSNLRIL